jgi:hypothetical protein
LEKDGLDIGEENLRIVDGLVLMIIIFEDYEGISLMPYK